MALMAQLYKTAISLTYEEQSFDERTTNLNLCKSRLTFSELVMVRSRQTLLANPHENWCCKSTEKTLRPTFDILSIDKWYPFYFTYLQKNTASLLRFNCCNWPVFFQE